MQGDQAGAGFVAVGDSVGLFRFADNPGVLPQASGWAIELRRFVPYRLPEVDIRQLSMLYGKGKWATGLAVTGIGFDAYRNVRIRAAARTMGNPAIGISIGMDRLVLGKLGRILRPIWGAGTRYVFAQGWAVGAFMYCTDNCRLSLLPQSVTVGVAHVATSSITLSLDVESEPETGSELWIGVLYGPMDGVLFTARAATSKTRASTSLQVKVNRIRIRLLVAFHPQLGRSEGVSFILSGRP